MVWTVWLDRRLNNAILLAYIERKVMKKLILAAAILFTAGCSGMTFGFKLSPEGMEVVTPIGTASVDSNSVSVSRN